MIRGLSGTAMAEDETGLGRGEDDQLQGQVKDLEHGVKQGGKVTLSLGAKRGTRRQLFSPFGTTGAQRRAKFFPPSFPIVLVFLWGLVGLAPPPPLLVFFFFGGGGYPGWSNEALSLGGTGTWGSLGSRYGGGGEPPAIPAVTYRISPPESGLLSFMAAHQVRPAGVDASVPSLNPPLAAPAPPVPDGFYDEPGVLRDHEGRHHRLDRPPR